MKKFDVRSAIGLIFVSLVFLGTCSPPKAAPDPPEATTDPKAVKSPVDRIKARSPEVTIQSPDGKSSYIVRAQESEVRMGEEGPTFGSFKDVTGDIVEDGKVVSKFQANNGKVDRASQTLQLAGSVKITSEAEKLDQDTNRPGDKEQIVLVAKSVKFDQGLGRLEAEGAVTVTSDGMVMGPLPKLWATRDLKKIATPGKFK